MKPYPFQIPPNKKIRVIVNTDCACEADDQYALAHYLMSPKIDVVGIVAEHFQNTPGNSSESESYNEIKRVVKLMQPDKKIPILHGAQTCLTSQDSVVRSDATDFIIHEALKSDERPLFLAGQAALTNIASAYLINPEIASKCILVWVGGASYPSGGWEFNLMNDIYAANTLLQSDMEIWQIPQNVYSKMNVSFFELLQKVYPYGKIGKYLVEKTFDVNPRMAALLSGMQSPAHESVSYPGGECWSMGDSTILGILLNTPSCYTMQEAPFVLEDGKYLQNNSHKVIRVYQDIDRDFIMNDFYSKLFYHFS